MWEIGDADKHVPSDTKSTSKVLRFMTYEESQYERPASVAALDSIGKRGDIVLIEGIRTGTAKVNLYSAKIKNDINSFNSGSGTTGILYSVTISFNIYKKVLIQNFLIKVAQKNCLDHKD